MSQVTTLTYVPRGESEFERAKDVRKILKKNLPIVNKVMIYLQPKSLHSLISVLLENLVNSREGGCCSSLLSRCNYIETGLISLVCLLYNLAMAIGVTLLVGVTCGQIASLNSAFSKHWLHAAIAACGIGISILGMISPLAGAITTGAMLSVIINRVRNAWNDLKLPSDEERVAIIKALYAQHREDLIQGLEQMAGKKEKVDRMIRRIDRAIDEARSVEQILMKCLKGIVHLPQAEN